MKLVYFEDDQYEPVEIKDLIEAASENAGRNGNNNMFGGLESLLGGGGIENLMKMFGGDEEGLVW